MQPKKALETALASCVVMSLCTLSDISRALPPGSAALDEYLKGVYGGSPSRSWSWEAADVVHERLLPALLRAGCVWPAGPSGRGSVYLQQRALGAGAGYMPTGLLWVYQHEQTCVAHRFGLPSSADSNASAASLRLHHRGSWAEVTHVFAADGRDAAVLQKLPSRPALTARHL